MTGIGLVGCGRWGINWARTLAALPQAELRWCCDVSPGVRARQQLPRARVTADVGEVLADPAVDAVVVATTAATHFELARRALGAGKHVLVEKPLTLTADDAVALHRLALERRRALLVGHLLEYHPAVLYVKKMIDSGELGEVHYLYSQRLNLGTVRSDENAWWSLAPHDVSVALRLLGDEPVSVQCRGQAVVQKGVADVVFAALEFPGGRLAHIHVSWLDPHKTRKLTVVGSKRMVVLDDMEATYKVAVYDKGCRPNEGVALGAGPIVTHQGDVLLPRIDGTEPLVLEANHFLDCVHGRARPISDGASGARVVSILEHGQRSLETGAVVPLRPPALEAAPARLAS